MDDRNYRDVFWCNISEKSVNRKTIKAKDLKLDVSSSITGMNIQSST